MKIEEQYLARVLERIRGAIGGAEEAVRERVQTLDEQKRYLWENRDIDPQEVRSVREGILNIHATGESAIARRARLGRMLDNPYFGRIDFRESSGGSSVGSGEAVPIYIGIHTFHDFDSRESLVHDWRAPVASMYYDYELGAAAYVSPAGEVVGEISRKRQYRIRGGRMEFMLESSVTVHDDVLQRELSANADDRMRNIVATIQREQNRIIRDVEASVLIIQGVAGSGKTSIALHRVAWLLYAQKETLTSRDILIISPNKVFADYISNVLPELGEEAVPEMGMAELLSEVLGGRLKYQSFFEQVAELLGKPIPGFAERISFKSTLDFAASLDRFVLHLENDCFCATDVKMRHITIPREYIGEQFRRFHRMAIRKRFEPMAGFIADELDIRYGIVATTAERNFLKREIRGMFAGGAGDLQLYKAFFEWLGRPEMFRLRRGHTLEHSDLAPLAWLRIALGGVKPRAGVRHLLIDEMQDYTPVQYRVIQRLFPCRKTLLGDAGQSVNPHGSSTAETIGQVFAGSKVMKLCKSYRSTFEITEFAQHIRPNDELEPVARHGEKPRILQFPTPETEIAAIEKLIADFRLSDYKSLGIVCKAESQAAELHEKLGDADISLLTSRSSAFARGVVVTSAHMAKGLEFDEVIVPQATDDNYRSEIDRGMLYVAATRAMHRLTLTHAGQVTRFTYS
ncbi:MAG: AAA family ATPase [Alistipes sp.]|jgi:DNA helicase-2/ATP-dependent DNA helicase PcrA|nr:AAA family ATPase [Alistipes sp.]